MNLWVGRLADRAPLHRRRVLSRVAQLLDLSAYRCLPRRVPLVNPFNGGAQPLPRPEREGFPSEQTKQSVERRRFTLGLVGLTAAIVGEPFPAFADQQTILAEQGSVNAEYGPEYSGGDITRPENNFEIRFEDRTSGSAEPTRERTLTLRRDGALALPSGWKFGWVTELPIIVSHEAGVGDAIFQGVLSHPIDDRWAYEFGARLVAPTAGDDLGAGKWQIVPGFGVRYSLLEFGSNTYFAPRIRYAISFAGDPGRRNRSEPQIAPTFNVGLPDHWFVTLFPSYDIRINFGEPASGQSGRLFLPFDAAVGKKLSDDIVASVEFAVPIVKQYPVYNFKAELTIAIQF